ncbi:Vesicular-fusion protein sec18 [Colletotrichum spinosum]|uniref:Vesicular-fusion protein SEC18 n=1 Tax=Colletotrichum spinosum TaxID=1347390 RepID=A0A4R8QQL1_9PEZI|nr:Vesicular-fusion protein sec18 [Colletotrichum spinosum]
MFDKERAPPGASAPRLPFIPLRVEKVSDRALQSQLIYQNVAGVSYKDFAPGHQGSDINVLLRVRDPIRGNVHEHIVRARPIPELPSGCISLSEPQRSWLRISIRDSFEGQQYDANRRDAHHLEAMDLEISWASAQRDPNREFTHEYLAKMFESYQSHFYAPGQRTLLDIEGLRLFATVKTIAFQDGSGPAAVTTTSNPSDRGFLSHKTLLSFFKSPDSDLKLKVGDHQGHAAPIISPDFDFEQLGVGGLGEEFNAVMRRCFNSRILPPALVEKLGVNHVKGMLLYGPPGTGKTRLARQIGKMLNAREPKIINGPEVLNKFVGQSEENIRKLFIDAEKEQKEKGDQSGLHIIIFDELDAVCKQRGSGAGGGTGVGDSVVNQLLSKLDGVNQLNNILLIGMTNRKDMIDEALLRPGRLEVQLEISLPNEEGRREILMIHTAKMRESNKMDAAVNLDVIAAETKNYSGAELEGVVKAATSHAMNRYRDPKTVARVQGNLDELKVTADDFEKALNDIKPAYGVSENDIDDALGMGLIKFSDNISSIMRTVMGYIDTVEESQTLRSLSILLHGPPESGKTALAAYAARKSNFPLIKIVKPQHLTVYRDEFGKKDYLTKVFADAHKSERSIVILDNIEQLIEWNPIGPRFSNTILDRLMSLIQTQPPKGHRIAVMVTTSARYVLSQLGVMRYLRRQVPVPAIADVRELAQVLVTLDLVQSEVEDVIRTIRNDTRSDKIGLGIKTVLESMEEAKVEASKTGVQLVDTLAMKLVSAISSVEME